MNRQEKIKWLYDLKNGKRDAIKTDCIVFDPDIDSLNTHSLIEYSGKCAHLVNGFCKPNCSYFRNKSNARLFKDELTGRYKEYLFHYTDFE